MSYAFFLVHMVMIVTVMHLLGRERLWSAPQAVALALAFLIGSYLLAVPLHRWVELPAMRLLSRPARTGPKDQHIRVPARTR